jgi:hypothetical protein
VSQAEPNQTTDEVLAEVRRVKDELAAAFDYDIDRIFDDLRRQQKESEAAGWKIIPAPPPPKTRNP